MARAAFTLLVLALFVGAVLLALYGVVLIGYDDSGGDAYVKIAGADRDADIVVAISILVSVLAAALAVLVLRWGRRKSHAP